jgi:hypothetical protein
MKKLQIIVLALGFMCLVAYVSKQTKYDSIDRLEVEPKKQFDSLQTALEKINSDSAKKTVEYLASDELEGRMSGKKGNVLAAEFIKNKFDELGYNTQYQKFKIRRLNSGPKNEIGDDFTQNVCAWSIGKDENRKKEIVVVGAHMDHIGYGPKMSMAPNKIKIHPGADDNASGTAALLEIAKGFSNMNNKRTILFIAFSAEEMGLLGSEFYVENPILPANDPNIKSHIFMLNMDMVGYLTKGKIKTSFENQESYWKPAMSNVNFDLQGIWPYNFCMAEVPCALGSALLKRNDQIIEKRTQRANKFIDSFKNFPELIFQKMYLQETTSEK